jgi:hypothetical protein
MAYQNRKEYNAAHTPAFQHCVRQHLIQCAKHAIKLAPLPDFKQAIAMLELYDREPSKLNRTRLNKFYREFSKGLKQRMRGYGYTAVGEIYLALLQGLWAALHRPNMSCTGDTIRYTEACYLAATIIDPMDSFYLPEKAMKCEGGWQHKNRIEVFAPVYETFKFSWGEYKKSLKQAA